MPAPSVALAFCQEPSCRERRDFRCQHHLRIPSQILLGNGREDAYFPGTKFTPIAMPQLILFIRRLAGSLRWKRCCYPTLIAAAIVGTVPFDGAASPRILAVGLPQEGRWPVTWESVAGLGYDVETSATLGPEGWQRPLGDLTAIGAATTARVQVVADAPQAFCRVAQREAPSRFATALEMAAIQQTTLGGLAENSLLLGNGDLNALLYASGAGLKLRLTKNDVWDARIDTASDPALAVVNVPAHTVTGGTGSPASWNPAYPCPLACAVLNLTSLGGASPWEKIRAEGTVNTWAYSNGVATMAIQGNAGASNGWRCPVTTGQVYTKVHVKLSGTSNARYYVEAVNTAGASVFGSLWQPTPTSPQDAYFNLPANTAVGQLLLYAWTTDGGLAKNNFTVVELQGPAGNAVFDLSLISPPSADYRLDVRRAVATVPAASGGGTVSVRALADRNAFLIEGNTTVTLNPTTATFVPAAVRGTRGGVEYLVQTLPADPGYPATGDWPGMSFVVAKAVSGQRTAVGVVTSMESATPLEAAIALVSDTLAADAGVLRQNHENAWTEFWSAARIDLGDTYLRDVWYRNLYFMRCVSKHGVKPVGLFAGLVSDSAAWHGDYHLNYNAQQTYWSWYGCNRAELSQPYEWLIEQLLPRAKWFGKLTYNCNGAFFPHSVFLYEPPDAAACKSRNNRQVAFIPFTYTLGDAGWAAQNHWLHYLFYPDRKLLETSVYPLLKEVAVFYADFADKCAITAATGKLRFGPTYSPEHWNLGKDDGTCDIAFARLALKAAVTGAGILGVDAALVTRWQQTLAKLPDYPRTTGAAPVILDVAGVSPTTYNVPVPALPVYPAGEITWFSPAADREIFSRTISTMSSNGNNDLCILAGARARLSMADAYSWTRAQFQSRQRANGTLSIAPQGGGFNDYGHFTEDFAAAGVITEMLLQSVNDILRFFPAWPTGKDAVFENLRAQGGFLVSAERKANLAVGGVQVRSTVGGSLRFVNPWAAMPTATRNGTAAPLTSEPNGILSLATATGDVIVLTPP